MADKPTVIVIGEMQPQSPLYQQLNADVNFVFADSADDVIDLTSDNESIDVVLVVAASFGEKAYETCMWLKTDNEVKQLPIIVLDHGDAAAAQWLSAGAIDCVDQSGNPVLLLARIKSCYELKRKTDLLADIASLDALTSLADKRRLDEYLDIEWRRSLREYYPLSMIKLDIDGFTAFNDQYGIGIGDDVMKRIARALEPTINRAADMLSRYSDDEFVALLPSVELDNALIIAEKMVEAVRDLDIQHDMANAGILTISAGVATIEPSRDKRYQDLLDEVEEMLGRAQQMGGDQAQGIAV